MYTVDLLESARERVTKGGRVANDDAGRPGQRTLGVSLVVNGRPRSAAVEPRELLVSVIRETWGLTGTKIGCDTSQCGACTVLLDGLAVKSCTVLAVQADGSELKTIEGLGESPGLSALQREFRDRHAVQCGFCTPGMIMTGAALLAAGLTSGQEQVREGLKGNICRCTGYQPIVAAVLAAAVLAAAGQGGSGPAGAAEAGQ
jgi:carbon-monoxide dehydrogenase small subunit